MTEYVAYLLFCGAIVTIAHSFLVIATFRWLVELSCYRSIAVGKLKHDLSQTLVGRA